MANEVKISITLSADPGNGSKVSRSETMFIDMAGDSFTHGVQEAPNGSSEALVESDILTHPGWVYLKNLDTTNYATFGNQTTLAQHPIKLLPGESTIIRWPGAGTVVYGAGNAGTVNIEYIIVEE